MEWLKERIHHSKTTWERTSRAKPRCCSLCCEACGPNLPRNRQKNNNGRSRNRQQRRRTARKEEKHRGTPKKMAGRTQHEGKTECAKESHGRCSQPPSMYVLKTADLRTQAFLVVDSCKLRLTALIIIIIIRNALFKLKKPITDFNIKTLLNR